MKTPEQIVEQANRLAREFYRLSGYVVRDGYRFNKATHPQEQAMWCMARAAFIELADTDPEDALIELDEI